MAAYNGGGLGVFSRAVAEYTPCKEVSPPATARSSPLEKLDVPGSVGASELINSLNV